jgi:hypothetical protein
MTYKNRNTDARHIISRYPTSLNSYVLVPKTLHQRTVAL